jgi:hypothetical protein
MKAKSDKGRSHTCCVSTNKVVIKKLYDLLYLVALVTCCKYTSKSSFTTHHVAKALGLKKLNLWKYDYSIPLRKNVQRQGPKK